MFLKNNRKLFLYYFSLYKHFFIGIVVISSLISFFLFLKLPMPVRFSIVPLGLITLLYQSKLPYFSFRQNGIIKIITVAFVWAMLIVVIPAIYFEGDALFIKLKFLFAFFYVLLLTLSFDQRDILIDKKNLGTIPQLFPRQKKYIYLVIGSVLITTAYYIFSGIDYYVALIMISISLILSWYSDNKKSFYYTAFVIEGLPIFWGIILFSITFFK
jgi:hypothetical protein